MSLIATLVCLGAISGLFYLDRDAQAHASKALWIPVIWMLIVGSRAVSEWGGAEHVANLAQRNAEGSPLDAAALINQLQRDNAHYENKQLHYRCNVDERETGVYDRRRSVLYC